MYLRGLVPGPSCAFSYRLVSSLPFILAKPLAVKTSVLCQDVPVPCQALARVPPMPSGARTSRGSVGTGLTSLILIILSWSSSPLLLPPSPPGRLLRYLCCSGCLLGNAPSPLHTEIGFGSGSGSYMWMSRLREVKKLAQGHTAVKRQSQDLNQIWLQISDFLLLITQSHVHRTSWAKVLDTSFWVEVLGAEATRRPCTRIEGKGPWDQDIYPSAPSCFGAT